MDVFAVIDAVASVLTHPVAVGLAVLLGVLRSKDWATPVYAGLVIVVWTMTMGAMPLEIVLGSFVGVASVCILAQIAVRALRRGRAR